jgi:glycosyltransferase involved in cell wall biosynthesis
MTETASLNGTDMVICIFSFNRGRFLENCVASIEKCAPFCRVVIFDDDSDDPETMAVLERLGERHDIFQPGHVSDHRLGGLYGNMQSALSHCGDASLLCFLQDDTQMVRPLAPEEVDEMCRQFDRNPRLGFLHPCFIRGINRERGVAYPYDADSRLYFREPTRRSAGRHFSALLITRPARLKEVGWTFAGSEPANNRQATEHFDPMGYLFSPFAMWLPEVPAYRGKKKTLGLKLAEKKRKCGYYPFHILDAEETRGLKERDPAILPIAEDFLHCDPVDPARPWAYNPLTDTGWLKTLNQAEVSLRRLFKR